MEEEDIMDEISIPKPILLAQVTHDVEQFIRNGGTITVIPPSYKPPTRHMVYIEDEYF